MFAIRLVTISSDLSEEGHIACSLEHFDGSASCPLYVAVSYKWGDPTPTHHIVIDGRVSRVAGNLWQYLQQAHESHETARLWIDAICLDQDNHIEKNEQVPRMGDIYTAAEYVIAWLGSDESGMEALRFVNHVAPLFSPVEVQIDKATRALQRLLDVESYWRRVWVLQEIICARKCVVVCGNVSVEMRTLVKSVEDTIYSLRSEELESELSRWTDTQFLRIAGLSSKLRFRESWKLCSLAVRMSDSHCGREVDRVYGLLGLARRLDPAFNPQLLDVNYDKSLDHVLWDVIFMRLETSGWEASIDITQILRLCDRSLIGPWSHSLTWSDYESRPGPRRFAVSDFESRAGLRSYAVADTTRKERKEAAAIVLQHVDSSVRRLINLHDQKLYDDLQRYNHNWSFEALHYRLSEHFYKCGRGTKPEGSCSIAIYPELSMQLVRMIISFADPHAHGVSSESYGPTGPHWLGASHLPAHDRYHGIDGPRNDSQADFPPDVQHERRSRYECYQSGRFCRYLETPIKCSASAGSSFVARMSCNNSFVGWELEEARLGVLVSRCDGGEGSLDAGVKVRTRLFCTICMEEW